MRHFLTIAYVLLASLAGAQTKKISAETTINKVTVYTSGARVERSSSVSITPGRSEISFAGLSNQLDQQSVQLKADADITLLSVQTTKDFLSQRKIDDEERALIDKANAAKDNLDWDAKQLEIYKNEESMLIKNQEIGGQSGVKAADLKDALDLQRQRLTDVYQKELEIQKRITLEQQDNEKFKQQLAGISKKKDSIKYVVTAIVESKTTRSVKFQLSYNIKDAGWYPTYDVRLNNISHPLDVLMNANVFQRSGETWKDVSLNLSTGNPTDNATPTELQPWMLSFFDPSISYSGRGATAGMVSGRIVNDKGEPVPFATVSLKGAGTSGSTDANGFFKITNVAYDAPMIVSSVGFVAKQVIAKPGYFTISLDRVASELSEVVVTAYGTTSDESDRTYSAPKMKEPRPETIHPVDVTMNYQPTTTVYQIDSKYTLETDGKTTTIGIKQFEIPALYEYFSTPKIDPSAFLTAKVINWQDYDLQSGEASLYFEGAYLGKTYIDLGSTGDTLSLSLGKDNGVKISRRLVKEFSSKRFIGSNRTDSRQYEISERNNKKDTINMIVTDQFPISTTKEIGVEDEDAPDAKVDKDSRIATWSLTLAPGQEQKLHISYSVKYPKDRRITLE